MLQTIPRLRKEFLWETVAIDEDLEVEADKSSKGRVTQCNILSAKSWRPLLQELEALGIVSSCNIVRFDDWLHVRAVAWIRETVASCPRQCRFDKTTATGPPMEGRPRKGTHFM
jgi:hypothetical protein